MIELFDLINTVGTVAFAISGVTVPENTARRFTPMILKWIAVCMYKNSATFGIGAFYFSGQRFKYLFVKLKAWLTSHTNAQKYPRSRSLSIVAACARMCLSLESVIPSFRYGVFALNSKNNPE